MKGVRKKVAVILAGITFAGWMASNRLERILSPDLSGWIYKGTGYYDNNKNREVDIGDTLVHIYADPTIDRVAIIKTDIVNLINGNFVSVAAEMQIAYPHGFLPYSCSRPVVFSYDPNGLFPERHHVGKVPPEY